ncbi:relaxase/mobilization nuclease domain-containing protein [Hufsiella ginkgonis]|uniref:Relaxase/mobilization nuclease domain-containing protein n=1 Tax=Hufsiella ginkgonis TaxID=2695274 RepID=A0A7K1Y0K3_9SPHI|nr:relaxase/mobilization nuclease domain-containing protein [Hufsiella ginkgonis]MXV16539.1 relaxase/mobilization nuclease domain-containing protein [Hufsiella ginkgonis]
MIGKVMTGKSFGGCIRYNLEREQATILHAEGIRTGSVQDIIHDFNMQRKMNSDLGKAVGHIVLSWSKHDRDKLTPQAMTERAKEYLQKMKITGTQFLVIRHTDREHPHLHIVYNRVNNDAKTISDQYQRKRNAEVCNQLTKKHSYYLATGKTEVKQERLTGADKVKYELYAAIKQAAGKATSWQELEGWLKEKDIGIQYKYKSGTNEIQGVSFSKDGNQFKGSEVDRGMSYSKLNQQIEQNGQQEQHIHRDVHHHTEEHEETETRWLQHSGGRNTNGAVDLLSGMLAPAPVDNSPIPDFLKKKKKKTHEQSRGITR